MTHNQIVHRSRDPVLENAWRHRRGPVTIVVLFQTTTGKNAMYRLIGLTILATVITGCGDRATTQNTQTLTAEHINFGAKWKAAGVNERRAMIDDLFQTEGSGTMLSATLLGLSKTQISELFGEATKTGIDGLGEEWERYQELLRYEVGDKPEVDSGGKYHLTFVFEDNVVVRVIRDN